jgi:hypothetical protein
LRVFRIAAPKLPAALAALDCDLMKIAQRFNAGGWTIHKTESRVGTKDAIKPGRAYKKSDSSVPEGTWLLLVIQKPSVKTLGYCHGEKR